MKRFLFMGLVAFLSGCNSEQVVGEGVESSVDSSPLLTKYIIGKPNMAYFDAEKDVALRWGINLKHIFAGSQNREEIDTKNLEIKDSNVEANRFYDEKFGKDWQIKFKEEVEKEINKN